jgi:hypothetical protein
VLEGLSATCAIKFADDNSITGACNITRPSLQITAGPTGSMTLLPSCVVVGDLVFTILIDHGGGFVVSRRTRFNLTGRLSTAGDTILAAAVSTDADGVPTLRQITLLALPGQ